MDFHPLLIHAYAEMSLSYTSAVLGHEFGPEIIGHEKNHALKDIWGSLGRKKNHAGSVGYRPVLVRESCPPRGMENALSKSIRGCDFYSRILFCTQ